MARSENRKPLAVRDEGREEVRRATAEPCTPGHERASDSGQGRFPLRRGHALCILDRRQTLLYNGPHSGRPTPHAD